MPVKYLQCYPLTTLPTALFGKAGRAFAKTKFYTVEKQTDRMLNFPEPKKKKKKEVVDEIVQGQAGQTE